MSLQAGQVLDGKYRIVRIIGEGGMGAVYEGENTRIRRRVAIKVLHSGVASSAEMVSRFEREAQVAGTVGNDHILEILDLGALPSGERYMVMEYLDGQTLTERIKSRGRLAPKEAFGLVKQALEGLSAAHGAGIVHRDLKPENIFILKQKAGHKDFVKIIDFGISKFVEQGASSRMTRTGALMGTPHYMAPEQATGSSEIDQRTDIYAVGIILYEAITGRVPFEAESFNQLLFEIALAKIQPARQFLPDLDPAVDTIILKATARDPRHRFQSCREFVAAIESWENTGAAVNLPPDQSIEAIVAATVPRSGGQGTPQATPAQSGVHRASVPGASGGRTPSPSVPDGSGAYTRPSGGPVLSVQEAARTTPYQGTNPHPAQHIGTTLPSETGEPRPPTVNTWANSRVDTIPKNGTPVIVATIVGVLFAGGAIAAYFLFGGRGEPAGHAAAPSATVAPAEITAAPPTAAVPTAAPTATAEATVAPVETSVAVTPAPSASAGKPSAQKPAPHPPVAQSEPHRPEQPDKPAKPKNTPINFGY
jgi:serine/threonine protein kinase